MDRLRLAAALNLDRLRLIGLGLLWSILCASPSTARAEEPPIPTAAEAAALAFDTHSRHCADVASGATVNAVASLVEVGEAWATVSRSYSQAPEPYLLYWRGILAQCLGQTERAIQDLRSFHDRNATDPDLRSLATDARRRLRTLGVNLKKPPAQPRTAGAALAPTGLGIATGIGWGGYYLDTLTLGMFAVRSRLSAYVLPWLSVDVPITFRAVPLIEVDGNDDEVRVVRTLPAFGLGATIRPPEGPVRPFAGIDLAFLLYAQAVVAQSDGSTATRPLFGPVLTARGGVEFHFADFLGVYVSAAGGFAYADRIQETVNALWATTTGIITLDSGVWFRLPMP